MIYLYSGTPGSGKSLHAVAEMLRYNRKGYPVIANFQLNPESVKNPDLMMWTDNQNLTPAMLEQYSAYYWQSEGGRVREDRILLVIDEAQLVFNARAWQKNSPWIVFFTQHRKMGFCVILIAQQREMIDKQVRAVLEYEYRHRVLSNAGPFGVVFSWILGTRFLYRKELAQIRTAGKGMKLGWSLGHYGRRVFRAYDTFKTW